MDQQSNHTVTPGVKPHKWFWVRQSTHDFHLSLGGKGMCWFGVVQFRWGSAAEKGAKVKEARRVHQHMLLLKQ